jgi:predicted ATPase/DNA-binding SARP family transcriptional activator/Tfp pilus assembly protein PilF
MTSVIAVSVQLLGGVRALVAGQEVTFSNDKRHQLLAFLAYAGDWVSREKLADLFYTDTSEVARQNLRRLLQRVQALEWLEQLEIERTRLRWKVETDYADFRKAFEANDLDRALNVYTGPFLQGLESYEDNEFATWLELERQRLHEQWREVIFKKARVSEPQQASNLFQRLLEQDEFDEEALLALMQVLHAGGQNQQALKTYQTFAERLKREMGLTPSSATQQFAEVLEQHKTAQPAITLSSNVSSSSSLPTPTTSFIGRDLELAEIASLLDENEVRLLTLLGPGGVGKTRIALQAASELARRYRDGAHFVSLESLTSPNAIPQAVAEALAITLQGQEELLEQVIDFLKVKNLLLVLDNFEHLVDGATIVSDFIRACPEVDILVTSRERLNLDEEHILSLEGLGIPNDKTSLEDALSYDAVVLFIERAKRVRSSFTLTKEELPAVLEICQLVQGFPLGIELAAAWVKLMPCQEIADEIAKNLDFLESSSRNALERHRSLRATFEYSWQLLTDKEQETLRKLSVFRGGFTREAASFVANANISLLAALVDKSLLRVLENRYDFHPLLHHYAQEKLAQVTADASQTRAKHALFFVDLVEQTSSGHSSRQVEILKQLDKEHDNVLEVLRWVQASAHPDLGLRLVAGLHDFWESRGLVAEGRAWLTTILSHPKAAEQPRLRGRALNSAGNLAWSHADYTAARAYFEEKLAIAISLADDDELAKTFNGLALVASEQGDNETARKHYEAALSILRNLGERDKMAVVINNLGIVATEQGDYETARTLYEESLAISRQHNNKSTMTLALINLGLTVWRLGDYDGAATLLQEGLELSRMLPHLPAVIASLSNLGIILLDKGEETSALEYSKEALALAWESKDKSTIAFSLESFASIAVTQNDVPRAARLWGAAERLREDIGSPLPPSWRSRYERFVATAKEQCGETAWVRHWQEGRKMELDEAVHYALE